ncbi:flagellar assembly protein FliH [Photobacterium sp. 1_MG-2023]|uniref:flagellar assembly protein FliH n=1 Tax=Photobacterium sp. 1_MG-2023 TaxID=3062646 RepID=UPI0026E4194C|nr:flagellar assembly protein FliH [Photobacterium sp. 1_MG-2023]MDO6705191.1 flagellar assembly protein FliH [Photobacterium sp. 1_MG-2023]
MTMERRRGFVRLSGHQAEELERWAYPDYSDEDQGPVENALNYDPSWRPREPVSEEPEPQPLTAADLEDIRQSAYEEGVEEGRAAGHAEGFEAGHQEGLAAGHLEGMEAGREEGLAVGQGTIDEHVASLNAIIEKLATPLQQVDQAVEQLMVEMVVALTRELIRVEVQTNPQMILSTVREAVASLPLASQHITVQLHPEDLALIQAAYSTQELENRRWQLQSEPGLSRGDVQIAAGDSTVDFCIEERIRHLLAQFLGMNRQPIPQEQAE